MPWVGVAGLLENGVVDPERWPCLACFLASWCQLLSAAAILSLKIVGLIVDPICILNSTKKLNDECIVLNGKSFEVSVLFLYLSHQGVEREGYVAAKNLYDDPGKVVDFASSIISNFVNQKSPPTPPFFFKF